MDTANGINYVTSATYQADGQMTGFVSGNKNRGQTGSLSERNSAEGVRKFKMRIE